MVRVPLQGGRAQSKATGGAVAVAGCCAEAEGHGEPSAAAILARGAIQQLAGWPLAGVGGGGGGDGGGCC